MSIGTMEVAQGEGGDDRRREVAANRVASMLTETYPTLDEEALEQFLKDNSPEEETPEPEAIIPDVPEKEAEPTAVEGGRAIYGYEPSTRHMGNVALAASVQSRGFMPAGLRFPGDQTQRFLPKFQKRASRYPRINGVY